MAGASIETTLELWAASLRDVKARMRPLFAQERAAVSAGLFLDGLLSDERRKTGWMRAEAAGDPGPWRQQTVLGRGHWDADALRAIARDYALETLADSDAVLVIDETGFLKQGKASCGVARQYTGSAGKITNCQIGVFAAYVSRHGHAFMDRALYLPKAWTDDPQRLAAAHVPAGIGFSTKPQLARAMIERAIAARTPFAWVAAESAYGSATSRGCCAGPERATCSASRASTTSTLGARSRLRARPMRSRRRSLRLAGNASRLAKGPRAPDCTIGPTSSWRIWTPQSSTRGPTGPGHGGCWSDATSPMESWRSSPPGVLPAPE